MTLDFNTPVCEYLGHQGSAVPATWKAEHSEYGVAYFCDDHPRTIKKFHEYKDWTITRINQHTQPAQERG